MKFITISKIPKTSQMLIIPFLSMHYNTICPPEDEQGTARNMLRIML